MNFLLYIPALAWLLISALFFACGEFLSKLWGNNPSITLTILVVIVYAFGTLSWLPVLLYKNQLAVMGTAWLLLATIATIVIGVLVFHEKISTLQGFGIVMAIIAMFLINTH
jgi:drug/metabolite transporter (DMT)-like permease